MNSNDRHDGISRQDLKIDIIKIVNKLMRLKEGLDLMRRETEDTERMGTSGMKNIIPGLRISPIGLKGY